MKRILVTAIGSAAADIVIKQLHKNEYYVVGTDIYPKEWVADADAVDSFYKVSTCDRVKEYITEILEICRAENVAYIIPLTDVEVDLYHANRHIFEENNIKICMSEEKTIDLCRNKAKLSAFLSEHTVCNVIPEIKEAQFETFQNYPVICKPVNGRSSSGIVICYCYEELKCFAECHCVAQYVIQPYLEGNIVTVDVLRDDNAQKCVVLARKELLRTTNGLGTTVSTFQDVAFEQKCCNIAEYLGVKGCVNFEFIETISGERYFMECNPRFSGGLEFSVLSGYDFVMNHVRCFRNENTDDCLNITKQIIVRKYEEYITKIYD